MEAEPRLGRGADGRWNGSISGSCGCGVEARLAVMQGGAASCVTLEGIFGFVFVFLVHLKHPASWMQLFCPFRDEKTETP